MNVFLNSLLSRKFLLTVGTVIMLVLDATNVLNLDEATRNQLLVIVLGYDLANIGSKAIVEYKTNK
jgi:hypothetical protein